MPRLWLALACMALLTACSAAQTKALHSVENALNKVPAGRALTLKYGKYAAVAEKLKQFHDSGVLESDDVLDILRTGGVIAGAPKTPGGARSRPVAPPVQNYGGAYVWPLDAGVVSSEFGARWGKKHEGMDIAASQGVPIKASANGTVMYAGSKLRGYGNVVIVRHDNAITTLYAHNKTLGVKEGDKVQQGQTIATLGSTGHSTGPHVHFELRDGEHPVNPRDRIAKSKDVASL